MANVDDFNEGPASGRPRGPMGLYARLIRVAGVCGMAAGVAAIVALSGDMFFLVVLPFILLAPIGCSAALMGLGWAAARGSVRAFYVSWLFATLLVVPTGIFVYALVLNRRPVGLVKELPRLPAEEIIGLAFLVTCYACLVAIVFVGFRVRAGLHTGPIRSQPPEELRT